MRPYSWDQEAKPSTRCGHADALWVSFLGASLWEHLSTMGPAAEVRTNRSLSRARACGPEAPLPARADEAATKGLRYYGPKRRDNYLRSNRWLGAPSPDKSLRTPGYEAVVAQRTSRLIIGHPALQGSLLSMIKVYLIKA